MYCKFAANACCRTTSLVTQRESFCSQVSLVEQDCTWLVLLFITHRTVSSSKRYFNLKRDKGEEEIIATAAMLWLVCLTSCCPSRLLRADIAALLILQLTVRGDRVWWPRCLIISTFHRWSSCDLQGCTQSTPRFCFPGRTITQSELFAKVKALSRVLE